MIENRIAALRARMKENKIDAYLVPTDDFHGSEYAGDYFKCRRYITGFTGSAGTAVIMQDMAGLWTDGRYFIQAEQELRGSPVRLFKMGEPGVPTIHEFLEQNLTGGMCLGFDGRTVSAAEAERLSALLCKKGVRLSEMQDLIGEIWNDRPALSCEPARELDVKWTGEARSSKIARIRSAMRDRGADTFLLTSLDDIAWLLNIRGNDIPCCPVVYAYLVLTAEVTGDAGIAENRVLTENCGSPAGAGETILLFANEKAFPAAVRKALEADGVELRPYEDIYRYAAVIPVGRRVLLCKEKVNSRLAGSIPSGVTVMDEENLTLLPKAVKNAVEIENERIAHRKDGTALTKFIYWLKKNVGKIPMTELSVTEKLYQFRAQQENFQGNSFEPILSYGPHAAIVHYSASPETDIPIEAKGLLLADTGGHYLEGTTDTTRTVAMGPVTEEQKRYFTAVLRGMLNLAAAKFRYGCTGINLDYLARGPLWEMGKDFNHGTGHGVGYYLNVHEAPNGFRWRRVPERSDSAVLEEGMITSDEPGFYVENEFGIRHENMIVCLKDEKNEFGQFMHFETLTMVPFDLDAVVPEQMSARERELLNSYHAQVYKKISPHLEEEERIWLKQATRPI